MTRRIRDRWRQMRWLRQVSFTVVAWLIALLSIHAVMPPHPLPLGLPPMAISAVAAQHASILAAAPALRPPQKIALAHTTNFGDRYQVDAYGRPVRNDFIAVLHETVGTASSAVNLFKTPHPREQDQVSYHTLIDHRGTIIYVVPPEKRAFGAGNSVFRGPHGTEAVVTDSKFPASVNNFAYHISLETPADGFNGARSHSGYTEAQYRSLAWLLAQSTIPDSRITTHRDVDRSGSRIDPRSFDRGHFLQLLHQYPNRNHLS